MSLFDRIASLLKRNRRTETEPTSTSERSAPPSLADAMARFSADSERREVIKTCREMYATDPRAEGVIRALARDMTRGGFTVSVPDSPEAEELASALVDRLRLFTRVDDWTRLTLRDGDSFLEVGINQRMEIAEVTRKPTLQMRRASNDADRFDDPARAYWWADELHWGMEPPTDAVWFADWQIAHARWAHDEGSRYGKPLFASATAAWKRITEGERDIAVRRKTRAGMKYVHRFPDGTDETTIESYREINRDALDNPWAAVADFFGTVDIAVVQGDARLGEIDDVLHHIRTWWLSSPVPMSLLGYGQDLNRDVLEQQKEQYDESLAALQTWVNDELIKPLVELEWLLHGIWPDALDYEVQWHKKQVLKPTDLRDLAEAALRLRALGLQDQTVWKLLEQFLPGVDIAGLVGEPTAGNARPSRMAVAAQELMPDEEQDRG